MWEGLLLKGCSAPGKLYPDFRTLHMCSCDYAEQVWGFLCIPVYSSISRSSLSIQKSLPLLENQIKKCHQTASEELQKYGADIPEDDNEKTFFLIDVSIAHRSRNEDCISVYTGTALWSSSDLMPTRLIELHPVHLVLKRESGQRLWLSVGWGLRGHFHFIHTDRRILPKAPKGGGGMKVFPAAKVPSPFCSGPMRRRWLIHFQGAYVLLLP